MPRIPQRRKAGDLYQRGRPIEIDDGATDWFEELDENDQPVLGADGEPIYTEQPLPPVVLFVAKLSDIEMNRASKHAAQAQAVTMAGKRDRDSDNWKAYAANLSDVKRDDLITTLVDKEMVGRQDIVEARLANETTIDEQGEEVPGKWAKDGYLEGLYAAWHETYKAIFAVNPDDPDALRILKEIGYFNDEVDKALKYEAEVERQVFSAWDDETLLAAVIDMLIAGEATEAWLEEYKRRVIFQSARDCEGPDPKRQGKCKCRGARARHLDLHFDDFVEVERLDTKVRDLIYNTFNDVQVDPQEGKGWPAKPASLEQSDLPDALVDSASSSPAT